MYSTEQRITDEINRAVAAENVLNDSIDTEVRRAVAMETEIVSLLGKETLRAKEAERELKRAITTDCWLTLFNNDTIETITVSDTKNLGPIRGPYILTLYLPTMEIGKQYRYDYTITGRMAPSSSDNYVVVNIFTSNAEADSNAVYAAVYNPIVYPLNLDKHTGLFPVYNTGTRYVPTDGNEFTIRINADCRFMRIK